MTQGSGGSMIQALDAARGAGARCDAALVIVDRQEGGAEALAAKGVRLLSIFTGAEFRTGG